MKAWNDLTERGQAQRLRPLVTRALSRYGIRDARIRLFEVATNVVFRIDADGASYAMKIDVEDDFTEQHVDISIDWLAAVNADTDIPVVQLVQARDGANYVYESADGVPENRRCTLYRWVYGNALFDVISDDAYRKLGVLTARLHSHAADYVPIAEPIRWDKVFYFPNEEVIYDHPEFRHRLNANMQKLVPECIEAVTPILESLYATPGRLIHADLHGWNVNVYRGGLTLLDFDDVMWGQPVHDIAITFGYKRDDDGYPGWIAAYEDGYRSVADWPVEDQAHIDALMVARRLMFTNYVLTFPDDISEYLTTWEQHFKDYLT